MMLPGTSDIPETDKLVCHYQPIISLQDQHIFGYEMLGRYRNGTQIETLGPFFMHPYVSDQKKLRIDRYLREQSLRYLTSVPNPPVLFINLRPTWIFHQYLLTKNPYTIQLLRQYGVPPSRIVIEITEEGFAGDIGQFLEVIEMYRDFGCTIAIDDVGSGFSNFDRIALVRPQIIKVDLKILKKSRNHEGYKALLRSFSILASQMGASLLMEGVETREDLRRSLQVGARFVQGYLFSAAGPGFLPAESYRTMLKQEIGRFTAEQFRHFDRSLTIENTVRKFIGNWTGSIQTGEEADHLIEQMTLILPEPCLRLYICHEEGTQISSNYTRKNGRWIKDEHVRGANWSWRAPLHSEYPQNEEGKARNCLPCLYGIWTV